LATSSGKVMEKLHVKIGLLIMEQQMLRAGL
jgi:hypothetical protein